MGRRAKKAPVQTKKRPKLDKRFKCPFCANEQAVECSMDHKNGVGKLSCRMCGAAYQMPIHHLHEPIDVFSEWLDDCEAAANPQRGHEEDGGAVPRYQEDDEDDDELERGTAFSRRSEGAKTGEGSAGQNARHENLGPEDSDDDE